MREIFKSGSVRGVKLFYKAEYCGTPQSKERRNGEYKVCLNERALRLLDQFAPARMSVTSFMKGDYENIPTGRIEENKPNQSQFPAPAPTKGAGKREKSLAAADSLIGISSNS